MNLIALARGAMQVAQSRKSEIVALSGIGEALVPTITLTSGEDVTAVARFEWDTAARALTTVRSVIALLECNVAMVALEAFHKSGPPEEMAAPEDYAQAFADGDQRVRESIVVYASDSEGNDCIASCTYEYEGRSVVYSDISYSMGSDASDGALTSAIRSGFSCQQRTPTVDARDVAEMLGIVVIVPHRTQQQEAGPNV